MLTPATYTLPGGDYVIAQVTDWAYTVIDDLADFWVTATGMALEGRACTKEGAVALAATYPGLVLDKTGGDTNPRILVVFGGPSGVGSSRIAFTWSNRMGQNRLRIYEQSPITQSWTVKLSFNTGSYDNETIYDVIMTAEEPYKISVGDQTTTLLPLLEEQRSMHVTVEPTNVVRTVSWGGAAKMVLPVGATKAGYYGLPPSTVISDGTITAPGYVTEAFTVSEGPDDIIISRSMAREDSTGYARLRVVCEVPATIYVAEGDGEYVGIGSAPTAWDYPVNTTLHLKAVGTTMTVEETIVIESDYTWMPAISDGPSTPDDPSNPSTPLPDPVDAENMLIRVYTALPGVVSYDNDGWPSEDIPDTATEGVLDIEVAPPNHWPMSLMTGGVLTFRVGNRSYTKRVEFCPNTSLAVHIGPDVVRVIGGSAPQEVFWKPDGLLSWLKPGLGTSRGTAEGEVDVEFQIETSGLLSITRGEKTYQELISYHGGTVHEIPYGEVTVKATVGTWGNYGALLPVVVVAILVIIAIAVILGR